MTQEVTIEQMNEVIADFMGYYYQAGKFYSKNKGTGNWFKEAKYHSSWDWLMPVVEKIGKLPATEAGQNKWRDIAEFALPSVEISLVHRSVYLYIEWYNQQSGREAGK